MALDARTASVLRGAVEREGSSLLQYVHDSYPWTSAQRRALLVQLRAIIDTERKALGRLIRFLHDHRMPVPPLGVYPSDFTSINYISLEHLGPLLADDQRRALLGLREDLQSLNDPAARDILEPLVELKGRHLAELEALAKGQPAAEAL